MIKGFIGTSLVDYPEKIAAVVFFGGCNFKCPYCQNTSLVSTEKLKWLPDISEDEIISKISNRARFIDGVVFSGGEPTIYSDSLFRVMTKIKTMQTCQSLRIKLDTNGSNPEVLDNLLQKGLLDYVAMDIKTSDQNYDKLTGYDKVIEKVDLSIKLLQSSRIDFEFRITVVPTIITEEVLLKIAEKVKDSRRLVLQQFRPKNTLDSSFESIQPYTNQELSNFCEILRKKFPFEVILRV